MENKLGHLGCAIEKVQTEKKRKNVPTLSGKWIFFNGNYEKFWNKRTYQIKSGTFSEIPDLNFDDSDGK